jgi:hypothetical protein
VLRQASADRPTTVELQVMEPDARVRFWRKIVIDHDGWKRYTVPLKWMRWSAIGVPSWNNVDRLGFWFRDGGDLWIDSIALEDLDPARGAALNADDVQAIAFPDEKPNAKVVTNDAVTIITRTTELNAEQLANHLQQVRQAIQADLSFLTFDNTSDLPILLISPTRQAHEKFAANLASAFNSEFGRPLGDGLTLQDVSMSYWDAQWGTLRPVYTNQYVRAVLGRALELTDRGEWFHEGMASRYHHKYHPQKGFNKFVQDSLARPDRFAPFSELCNGKSVSKGRSWQAMTLVDMLLTHQDYRGHLPKFVEIIRSSGSTNLNPVLEPVFGKSWEVLTNDWREHCEKSYPIKSDKTVAQAG